MKRVIIMGGGYSTKEGIEKGLWDKIKEFEIWSLNSIYKIMPYLPTRQLWVDKEFFNHEISNMQKLYEQGVELISREMFNNKFFRDYITIYGSTRLIEEYYGKKAIEKNLIYYGQMGLCGSFALTVAIARGYDDISLLGFDFGSPNLQQKQTHVYQDKIAELDIKSTGAGRPEVYLLPDGKIRNEIDDWKVYLNETDVKINNISLISNLKIFPQYSYDEFFKMLNEELK